ILEVPVNYSTLMVHLELEHQNDARLQIASELAEQFDAKLIGIAASEPHPTYYSEGPLAQRMIEQEAEAVTKRMAEAEARFLAVAEKRARKIEWRSASDRPTDFVAREARAADLIITGSIRGASLLDAPYQLDPGDLVMKAGRPIFVVPPEVEFLKLKNV